MNANFGSQFEPCYDCSDKRLGLNKEIFSSFNYQLDSIAINTLYLNLN